VADHEAKFAVTLEDHVTTAAGKATASLEHLKSGLEHAGKSAGEAGHGFYKIKDPVEIAHNALEGMSAGLKEFGNALKSGNVGGMIDGVTESLAGMAQTLDLIVPGLGQAAAAVIKVAGGIAGFAAEAIEGAVEMSLEVTAANDKMIATFDALGTQGPKSGEKTLAMLDQLSAKLPQSREQLAKWTTGIEAMGITDLGQIRQQLLATASAQAIMGDTGAAAYDMLSKKVREAVEAHHGLKLGERTLTQLYNAGVNVDSISKKMGLSTKQLAAELKKGTLDAQAFGNALSSTLIEKGAKPLDVMGDELGTLKSKASETFAHLFDGIDTSPLTEALRNVISLGDQGEPSGQALKKGMTAGLNAIIKMLGHAVTEAEVFFLEIEVKALEAYIALKPLIKGFETIDRLVSKAIPAAQKPGEATTAGGAARTALSAVSMTSIATGGVADGAKLGLNIVSGLLDALGAAKVRAFLGGEALGKATISGLHEGTGSHSPSVPAMKIGGFLGAGLGMGMVRSREPQRAARQISGNALGGMMQAAAGAGMGGGGARGGGHHVEIGAVNVHAAQGVTDAQQLSVIGLSTALERFQLGSGR
jgi:hypothetical protein